MERIEALSHAEYYKCVRVLCECLSVNKSVYVSKCVYV